MFARTLTIRAGALLALALAGTGVACAEAPAVTPVMQKAFVQYDQGPEALRRFVHRTRMIYALSYAEVVASYDAVRSAQAVPTPDPSRLASSSPDVR